MMDKTSSEGFRKWSEEDVWREVKILREMVVTMEKRFDERFLKLEFASNTTQQVITDISEALSPEVCLARNASYDSNFSLLSENSTAQTSPPSSGDASPNEVDSSEVMSNNNLFFLKITGLKVKMSHSQQLTAESEAEKFNSLLKQFADFLKNELRMKKHIIPDLHVACIITFDVGVYKGSVDATPQIIVGFKNSFHLEAVYEFSPEAKTQGYTFKVMNEKQMEVIRENPAYNFYFSFFERKMRLNQGDLLRSASPDRRRSPKNSTENIAASSDDVVDGPGNFTRNFLRKTVAGKTQTTEEKDKTKAFKFSPRRSLRKKLKKSSSNLDKNMLENKSPASTKTCGKCRKDIDASSDHISLKGQHYHRKCFKCNRCDASLTLHKANRIERNIEEVFLSKYEDNDQTADELVIPRPKVETSRSLTDIPEDLKEESDHEESYKHPATLRRFNSSGSSFTESRSRLRSRRCAVSATDSYHSIDQEDEYSQKRDMPIKRNSFRISARFIGSMQKHTISKSKAERIAAAAAMATMLTDDTRQADGNFLCDPCAKPHPGESIANGVSDAAKNDELFAILEKVQGTRMDEQRCSMHFPINNNLPNNIKEQTPANPSIEAVIKKGKPYPQVIPPPNGGYWQKGFGPNSKHLKADQSSLQAPKLKGKSNVFVEDSCTSYRRHFIGKEHMNFIANDEKHGPLIMSLKHENSTTCEEGFHRIILRSKESSWTRRLPAGENNNIVAMAKNICGDITVDRFIPVVSTNSWQSILQFDEHTLNSAHKFGLVYQKPKQTKEEELFGNKEESPALKEFIDFLGETIQLQGFTGFRGGLDVQNGHTGITSLCGKYDEKEIMFHVSTMLPYIDGDRQQLQRKRHIGNDVVAIVFQDEATPFVPNMITSHFLHAFIVVQPINSGTENVKYKVSVTAKDDVPSFGPDLPEPAIFEKDEDFKNWLYCKLINAERSCYKSQEFAKLQLRTRSLLMDELYNEIYTQTMNLMGFSMTSSNENIPETTKESGSGFLDAFRKFKRGRSSSVDQSNSPATPRKGGNSVVDGKMQASPSFSDKRSSTTSIERSSTFDENDKLKLKHKSDSGSLHKVHSAGVMLDTGDKSGSNFSLCESPKRNRRPRPHSPCPSCGSYTSFDSDTGLESMASTHTDSWPRYRKNTTGSRTSGHTGSNNNIEQHGEMEHLRAEISKLRAEKNEWSINKQEYMNAEKELRRLKAKESEQEHEIEQLSDKIHILQVERISSTHEHIV